MQTGRLVRIPSADRWAEITNADRWKRNINFVEHTLNSDSVERLADVFTACDVSQYYRQGSIASEKAYPTDKFVTFWQSMSDIQHYNNKVAYYVLSWQISYYTQHADTLYEDTDRLMFAFENAGYTITQCAIDVASDRNDYYGRIFEIKEVVTC